MSQHSHVAQHCVCGAALARDNTGGRCASCLAKARLQPQGAPEVPADFWQHDAIRDALAQRHMGLVIRAFRNHPGHGRRGITQQTAAGWAGITQAQLSRIESGAPILTSTDLHSGPRRSEFRPNTFGSACRTEKAPQGSPTK
jgi:hypothetical protein